MWFEWYGTELWGPNLQPTPADGILFLVITICLAIYLLSGFKNDKEDKD